jgi:hypothetical protein
MVPDQAAEVSPLAVSAVVAVSAILAVSAMSTIAPTSSLSCFEFRARPLAINVEFTNVLEYIACFVPAGAWGGSLGSVASCPLLAGTSV